MQREAIKRKWLRGLAQIVWKGARDPVRRRRWKLLFRFGCLVALVSLFLFCCLGCLLLGALAGRVSAGGPGIGLGGSPVAEGVHSAGLDGDVHTARPALAMGGCGWTGDGPAAGSAGRPLGWPPVY